MKRCQYLVLLVILFIAKAGSGQGRVVINEFMPWSGCNTGSEFIELLNFGPGPMNIGCYIVTNGTYSVTIPPNTILQPRAYYILAGQNVLAKNCGNVDSAVRVDLNWYTCGCTNDLIPAGGDGFFKNGGNANEKVILMDPQLNIIDAVTRNLPASSSVPIITSSVNGQCSSRSFNLTGMEIFYETIGISTGIDNSFARRVDGDCGWVKTTAISADAPNKTGSTSSATYQFSTLGAYDCETTMGSISIDVSAPDLNTLFPMTYTLGFDADSNGLYTDADVYTYGIDSTAPTIQINNLVYGRYRLTVASSSACNLRTFDFFIFNCYGVLLPMKLLYFSYKGQVDNQYLFSYQVSDPDKLKEVVLEGHDGLSYHSITQEVGPFLNGPQLIKASQPGFKTYRIRLREVYGTVTFSQDVRIPLNTGPEMKFWPNPVKDIINMEFTSERAEKLSLEIYNLSGTVIRKTDMVVNKGKQQISIAIDFLRNGIYYIKMSGSTYQYSFSFVKAD